MFPAQFYVDGTISQYLKSILHTTIDMAQWGKISEKPIKVLDLRKVLA